jgi:SPP1 gp7 family putative phage head morphogenesis protein
MCEICDNTKTVNVNIRGIDPTHTETLRNAFVAEMNRRFKHVGGLVTKAIIDEDVFGLSTQQLVVNAIPPSRAFAFLSKPEKIKAFLKWLRQIEDAVLLETRIDSRYGTLSDDPWFSMYLAKAYEQGSKRAIQEMKKAGLTITLNDPMTGKVYINPVSVEKLMLIYTRAYTDLQGITAAMDAQISRILAQGLIDGRGPIELARMINSAIIGSGETLGIDISYVNKAGKTVTYFMSGRRRAEILARTEIIRSHHLATIAEYRTWEVEGVYVLAEFVTAGDLRVCPECSALQNTIWTLDEIENIIPVHPQCRCVSIPFVDKTRTKVGEQ